MDNVPLVEFDLPQVEPWVFLYIREYVHASGLLTIRRRGLNGTVRPLSAFLRPVPRVGK